MKCWECKKKVRKATIVSYYQEDYYGVPVAEQSRYVCDECFPKLTFNSCHYVLSKSPRSRTLKTNKGV